MSGGWRFFADRGGTFTDIVALAPDNGVHIQKLLSASSAYSDPVEAGIRQILDRCRADYPGSELADISEIRVGTTIGTNALLEHKIARVGLLITQGFKDLIRIGYQSRPDIFALNIQLPELLYVEASEVVERIDARGQILTGLRLDSLAIATERLVQNNVDCIAILFLNSAKNPRHESQAVEYIKKHFSLPVYPSHVSSPFPGAVSRGDTTLVDAALGPLIQNYAKQVESISEAPVYFMGSAGTLFPAMEFSGKDSLLSGPAGGVNAVAALCRDYGIERAVGFDMGGTSTDVFCYDGRLERQESSEVGGFRIQAPHLRIHTIASGGGSILRRDGLRLLVGPESAGANPGPAFYGMDGPATLTDANVVLGRVISHRFPAIFGPGRNAPPESKLAVKALQALLGPGTDSEIPSQGKPLEELAEGFLGIASEQMAGAVRKMTIEQGRDPAQYAMISFGGAGGQVACEVARRAGVKRIIFPGLAGLFSAVGIGKTRHSSLTTISCGMELQKGYVQSRQEFREITSRSKDAGMRLEFRVFPVGSDFHVSLGYQEWPEFDTLNKDFRTRFKQLYGYEPSSGNLGSVLVERFIGGSILSEMAHSQPVKASSETAEERVQVYQSGWQDTVHRSRTTLAAGEKLVGPALLSSDTDTVYIAPGWQGSVGSNGDLDIHYAGVEDLQQESSTLEIAAEIHQRKLESIAIEMGTVLQRTSRSVNIKERLDFSCAIFDGRGRILVSAPHIPVHLGSMQDSVEAVLPLLKSISSSEGSEIRTSDVRDENPIASKQGFFLLNDPYQGGTHLPDVTVVCPVYLSSDGLASSRSLKQGTIETNSVTNPPDYFVAARGHHADIGGISPGSMPARSHSIQDEGILISPAWFGHHALLEGGAVEILFREGGARSPETNRADIAAQVAACIRGIEMLQSLDRHRLREKEDYLRNAARHAIQQSLSRILKTEADARLELDPEDQEGIDHKSAPRHAYIDLNMRIRKKRFLLDFSNSSPPPISNFQTPASVVRSAVLYSLYLIAGRSIPLNAGALEDIDLDLGGSFLKARYPMPVVAGNVETSQVLVDVILMAAGVLSPGPGTMNNLSFGNDRYQYYETIGGGAGAGPGFSGTSAVQCHMTNSRITDPEILESRFPVILEEFSIRRGSGGNGKFTGGDGIVRQIRFLEKMMVSILSNRRKTSAPGLMGGRPGLPGKNFLISDGTMRELDYCDTLELNSGDAIRIETPGGSGYGKKE